jgi:cation diffusion facilitator CzcD-associated flavoprotein CzcO
MPLPEILMFTIFTKRSYSVVSADVAIIGAGPGGYVAAIKAAQSGLKVNTCLIVDYLYRERVYSWRNMPECRMHSIEGIVKYDIFI